MSRLVWVLGKMAEIPQTPKKILRKPIEFEIIKVEEDKFKYHYYVQRGENRYEIDIKEDYEEILESIKKKIEVLSILKLEKSKEKIKEEIMLDIFTLIAKLEQF